MCPGSGRRGQPCGLLELPCFPAVDAAREHVLFGLLPVDWMAALRPSGPHVAPAEPDENLAAPAPDAVICRPAAVPARCACDRHMLGCCSSRGGDRGSCRILAWNRGLRHERRRSDHPTDQRSSQRGGLTQSVHPGLTWIRAAERRAAIIVWQPRRGALRQFRYAAATSAATRETLRSRCSRRAGHRQRQWARVDSARRKADSDSPWRGKRSELRDQLVEQGLRCTASPRDPSMKLR